MKGTWIVKVLRAIGSKQKRPVLQRILDDDIAEVEMLELAQQSGAFEQLSRSQLIAIAQRQAKLLEVLSEPPNQSAAQLQPATDQSNSSESHADQALPEAHAGVRGLAAANRVIRQLSRQLEQVSSERERALRRFGREKAALEMRLLALGDEASKRSR